MFNMTKMMTDVSVIKCTSASLILHMTFNLTLTLTVINFVLRNFCHFYNISVTSQLGSRRYPIYEIEVVRPRFQPQSSYSASQECNNYTTDTPIIKIYSFFKLKILSRDNLYMFNKNIVGFSMKTWCDTMCLCAGDTSYQAKRQQ